MPVFKSSSVFAIVRNLTAFLNVEAGITRSTLEQHRWDPGVFTQPDAQTERSQPESQPVREAAGVKPENIVWIFSYGSGRSGTTWLSKMLKHLDGYDLWKSPRVGTLFGDFYYDHPVSLRNGDRPEHILGPDKHTWLGPMQSFILEGIALRYPELTQPGSESQYLFISDHHGSLGAPLIMEALPESRMLLMMRDPRDVAASTREASKSTGWVRKVEKVDERNLADIDPVAFMKAHVENNVRSMGHSRQAYDAHQGPKTILKYEDLRADTLAAMKRTLSTLGLPFDEVQLAEAVETYSWENVPEKKKGEGQFHRKATPGGWKEDLSQEEIRIVEEGFESLINEFYADASVREEPAQARPEPAAKYPRFSRGAVGVEPENKPRPAGDATAVKPENIICLFGPGRSGSAPLVRMMRDLGYAIWSEPRLEDDIGHPHDARGEESEDGPRTSSGSVLETNRETLRGQVRSFILGSSGSRFPQLRKGDGTLVIKGVHDTIGAPLLMEALPESKMIFLVRDPRDVVASRVDSSRPGGRARKQTSKRRRASSATTQRDVNVPGAARRYRRDMEIAKQAYNAHEGPKILVRYEDLRADTSGTMKRIHSALGMEVDEEDLARAVRKHPWETIPENEEGEDGSHHEATPSSWKEALTPEQAEMVEGATAPILDEFYPSTERVLPFTFRSGTQDGGVFRSINVRNEYRLPDSFEADDVIVDIGANIGSFCYAALRRGSDYVYGFEPEKDNFACAVRNLRSFGDRVRLYNKAVWRSDSVGGSLFFNPASDEAKTAGGDVFARNGEEVETVAFDDVIREVTANGDKRVKLLKIDCEGSEFPILLTSQSLHLIDEIRGEYHEFGGEYDDHSIPEVAQISGYDRFTIAELTDALQRAGFSVESDRSGNTRQGHFFATRAS